ncbi:hypothetical protein QCA50_012611 [Cerrena zonata]|uniref:Uncharacterized protein n=1 Tax=Cerrena zonata TaxID=2478898 RepID=A0AAW0FY92_9APHY
MLINFRSIQDFLAQNWFNGKMNVAEHHVEATKCEEYNIEASIVGLRNVGCNCERLKVLFDATRQVVPEMRLGEYIHNLLSLSDRICRIAN